MMLLPDTPSSWVGILDRQRITTSQSAVEVACLQLRAVLPLLQRPVVIVADRWYATPEFLQTCRELGCRVIIRLKRNRKLYRPPVRTHKRGAPPKDGPLFQGTRPETLGEADESWQGEYNGKSVRVGRWNHLHVSQARDLSLSVVRVQREQATNTKRDPRESWFVLLDDRIPLKQVVSIYARRFSQEYGYRFRHRNSCCGTRLRSELQSNMSDGVGWSRWLRTSCCSLVTWDTPLFVRGNVPRLMPSPLSRCVEA